VTALPSAPNDSANSPLRQWWLMLLVVAVGIGLRCMQAFEDRALWLDEAMLALNVRRLSLTELCGPLQYDQAAPVGFLWLQKLASYVASDAEISARIVPWAAGCLGLILFAKLIFNTTGPVALLAVTAMAFSPTLICYSGEAKQYSLDVLCTVWALSAGLRWMQFPTRTSAVRAAILCAVAPWLSHAGVFFFAGCSAPRCCLPQAHRLAFECRLCSGSRLVGPDVVLGEHSRSARQHGAQQLLAFRLRAVESDQRRADRV
jgi:predicted membrane-bound mannosyltransferase